MTDPLESTLADEDIHAADAHHVGGGHDHPHAAGHGHEDDHAADHAGEPLGPIDWGAWLISLVGLTAGGIVAIVLAQTIAHG
jgi:ABC-type nickel/cobalt efflux system permease component RcnA